MDEEGNERIKRMHRLKTAVEGKRGARLEKGSVACPSCARNGRLAQRAERVVFLVRRVWLTRPWTFLPREIDELRRSA